MVLDDGRLAGIGKHKELFENCPVYREICLSQLSGRGGGTSNVKGRKQREDTEAEAYDEAGASRISDITDGWFSCRRFWPE